MKTTPFSRSEHAALAPVEWRLAQEHAMWIAPYSRLENVMSDEVEAAATDGKSIVWNRTFFDDADDELKSFIVGHELWHVVHCHHMRRGNRDQLKWNEACDIEANTSMAKAGWKVPSFFIQPQPKFDGMSPEQIYAAREKQAAETPQESGGNGEQDGNEDGTKDGDGDGGADGGTDGAGAGEGDQSGTDGDAADAGDGDDSQDSAVGSDGPGDDGEGEGDGDGGAGEGDGEDGDGDAADGSGGGGQPAGADAGDAGDGTGDDSGDVGQPVVKRAKPWRPGDDPALIGKVIEPEGRIGTEEVADEQAKWQIIVSAAVQAAALRGQGAGEFAEMLEKGVPSRRDLSDALRSWASNAARVGYRMIPPRMSLVNQDMYLPSQTKPGLPFVAVIADTSGSISRRQLEAAKAIVDGFLEDYPGTSGVLVMADTQVAEGGVHEFVDRLPEITEWRGRGGTNFAPAFAYVEERYPETGVCVILTDCDGAWPVDEPQFTVIVGVFRGYFGSKDAPGWASEVVPIET